MRSEFMENLKSQIEAHLVSEMFKAMREVWNDPLMPLSEVMELASKKAALSVLDKHDQAWSHKFQNLYGPD